MVERALGRNHPIAQDYSASVLATWRVSINAIAKEYPGAAKFLYLLCFLDPSNLRKDLFKRACSPKLYLNREGSIDVLYPWMNRVPDWLLRLFCGPNGHWNDLQFFDTIGIISALFFIECKDLIGTWVHPSGEVEGTTLTSDGSSVTLLELPQPLHHLGRCFHDDKSREEFIHDAFSVAIHSFQNDIKRDGNYSNIGRTPMMYVGFGGAIDNRKKMERQLDEVYEHFRALQSKSDSSWTIFNYAIPVRRRCEAIMFASIFWPRLFSQPRFATSPEPFEWKMPSWGTILTIAESVLLKTGRTTQRTPRPSPNPSLNGQKFRRPNRSSSAIPSSSSSPSPSRSSSPSPSRHTARRTARNIGQLLTQRTGLLPQGEQYSNLDWDEKDYVDENTDPYDNDIKDSVSDYYCPDSDDEFRIEWNRRRLLDHNKVSVLEIKELQISIEISERQSPFKNEGLDIPPQHHGLGLPEVHMVAMMAEKMWVTQGRRPNYEGWKAVSDGIKRQLRQRMVEELVFQRWLGSQVGKHFRQRIEALENEFDQQTC